MLFARVEYDGVGFLSLINVWDAGRTKSQLDPLDAETMSVMFLTKALSQRNDVFSYT
ncbi:MAG: hypothetical protein ABJU19_14080 [Roseobacter sp.]